ncbi:hypothetical protein TYRP_015777 [Tyrophagus putrescentiae]|nr:hypothetical protein TYRP_015777 [Tyrophagus putrescentiae]
MIGSLVSFLTRWINRQLLLSFLVMMQALTLMFLPFYPHYWLAFVMMVLSNVGAGGWDSATSLWLVELWPTKNSAILQANQFMYGTGSILAPLLAAPFLHGIKSEVLVGNETRLLTVEDRIMSLSIPFGVNGFLQGIVPVIFFLMYFAFPYKASEEGSRDKDSINLRKAPTEKIPHRNTKLVLMGLCLGTFLAAEMGFQIFAPSMLQYLPIKMTATTAFISLKVSIDIILAYHFVIQLLSVGIFYINSNNLTMIYIGMALMGYD